MKLLPATVLDQFGKCIYQDLMAPFTNGMVVNFDTIYDQNTIVSTPKNSHFEIFHWMPLCKYFDKLPKIQFIQSLGDNHLYKSKIVAQGLYDDYPLTLEINLEPENFNKTLNNINYAQKYQKSDDLLSYEFKKLLYDIIDNPIMIDENDQPIQLEIKMDKSTVNYVDQNPFIMLSPLRTTPTTQIDLIKLSNIISSQYRTFIFVSDLYSKFNKRSIIFTIKMMDSLIGGSVELH